MLASTSARRAPFLDESSFQQLLAAAYVVQQHNDALGAKKARLETSQVLAQIAEIQSLARTCSLETPAVCALAADRLRKVTDANGVSIGLVTDGYLDCVAESGVPARIPASSIACHSLVATERLKSGEMFESDDAQNDIRLDVTLCLEMKTGSLIAAPIHRFGELSGLLEVRWNRTGAFQRDDARACRLMAELITTTLEGEARHGMGASSQSVFSEAPEPATGGSPVGTRPDTRDVSIETSDETRIQSEDDSQAAVERCRVCGHSFGSDEVFCGNCSMPRLAASAGDGLQSKWASMWFMQQAQGVRQPRDLASQRSESRWLPPSTEPKPVEPESPASDLPTSNPPTGNRPTEALRSLWTKPDESFTASPATPYTSLAQSIAVDLSALVADEEGRDSARATLWRRHPIRVVLGSIAVFLLITMWAFSPSPGNGQITRLESLLIELGLAEVPSKPAVAAGRADARVWVDVHTALYYCEGSDLYGKTPEGRFTTQREAQQDQFESASQLPCN